MRDAHQCSGPPSLQNDLYCVEWDVKLYYTIPQKVYMKNWSVCPPLLSIEVVVIATFFLVKLVKYFILFVWLIFFVLPLLVPY